MQRHFVTGALRLCREYACEIAGCKTFVEGMVGKRKKAHGQKAARIEHSSFETWDGMDLGGGGTRKLLCERF